MQGRLRSLLEESSTIKIATAGGRRSPWIAAAYFALVDPFCLEVLLEAGGATLSNLRASPAAALMLESGDPFRPFAQAAARAEAGAGADADRVRAAITARSPVSAPLVALPGLVPVRLLIDAWWLTDVSRGVLPAHELRPAERVPVPGGSGGW